MSCLKEVRKFYHLFPAFGNEFYWKFWNSLFAKYSGCTAEVGLLVYASADSNWTANTSQKTDKYSSSAEFKRSDITQLQRKTS